MKVMKVMKVTVTVARDYGCRMDRCTCGLRRITFCEGGKKAATAYIAESGAARTNAQPCPAPGRKRHIWHRQAMPPSMAVVNSAVMAFWHNAVDVKGAAC